MPASRLKIAYLCDWSPLDRNLYSGGNARIYDALRANVGEVTILSNSWFAAEPLRRLMHAMPEPINLRARWRLHLALGRVAWAGLSRELARDRYDVLFGAYSFQSFAGMRLPYPIFTAYTADATPTGYKRSEIGAGHGSFLALSRLFDPLIHRAETRIFRNLDLLLWPAAWQKQTADRLYGLDPARSVIVPWGANIDDPGEGAPVTLDPKGPLNLLFVGRNWQAKGGPLAVEVLHDLRASGIDARLTVIGCTPPLDPAPWLTVHAELDKAVPEQLATFENAYRQAHFMVMASLESYGFAFCEASAYGLPSLALRLGGVPVLDGVNGHALPPGSPAADFAAIIRRYLADPAAYATLRADARARYERDLNWDRWGQRTAELLAEGVARKRAGG